MNELKTSLHAVNLALRTVKIAETIKKTAVIIAAGVCCMMLYRGVRSRG